MRNELRNQKEVARDKTVKTDWRIGRISLRTCDYMIVAMQRT